MCFDVISEIMCVWRRKITLCAIVWLLPTVNEHVPLQITSSAKGLSALLTVVYFLPTVGDHVPPQDLWHWTLAYVLSVLWVNMWICLTKRLSALWALVHLVYSWSGQMICHFALVWHGLGTISTEVLAELNDLSPTPCIAQIIKTLTCLIE